jgi:tRNA pseudouridine55 synthase
MSNNFLVAGYKPTGVSSNNFLQRMRRRFKSRTAGYSGTLDPFAKGVLVIADGKYAKLFRFFDKSPKSYRATLWLGVTSESLDIERTTNITITAPTTNDLLLEKIEALKEIKEMVPPKFCAKRIDGKKAYELAREGKEFEIKPMKVEIYEAKLICYSHPFVTFEASVSEGTYIRTLGHILAKSLGYDGTLCSLERLCEGRFKFEQYKELDPLQYISLPENFCTKSEEDILNGKKIAHDEMRNSSEGLYLLNFEQFFSIIQITKEKVSYILNGIEKFQR